MLVGQMRVSKTDGSQSTYLERDALLAAGVAKGNLYEYQSSGKRDDRPSLRRACKASATATPSWCGSSIGSAAICVTWSTRFTT
jgi:DNA invertase Pin-like site-specific DNA recombinase